MSDPNDFPDYGDEYPPGIAGHLYRKADERIRKASMTSIDVAWASVKSAAGDGARITVAERDTTVEAYAQRDRQSIGFGYGPTVAEALLALEEKLMRDKADG